MQTWGLCMLFAVPGVFFLVMTYGALIVSKKTGKHISGVPCIGGICLILAFLLSPCKWLALLGLLDYGLWELPYLLLRDLVFHSSPKPDADTAQPPEHADSE